jgi:hypothetical protein
MVAQEEDPQNFLIMHAMAPNVAGVIGSAVAAGVLLATFRSGAIETEGALETLRGAVQAVLAVVA